MSDATAISVTIGIVALTLQVFTLAIAREAIRAARHDGWIAGYEACRDNRRKWQQ